MKSQHSEATGPASGAHGLRTLLALLTALTIASAARAAEVVTLKGGDKVSGSLSSMTKKKLHIDTDYAGAIDVDWTLVTGLECDRPAAVWTLDDTRYEGTIKTGPEGTLTIQPASGAATQLELAKIRKIRLLGAAWSGFVDVAVRDTEGNSSTVGALLQGEVLRTTEVNEIKLKGLFRYGENQTSVSEASWYTLGRYRHDIAGPIFAYVSAEFMQDRFKDIDLNTILSGGLGVTILEQDWIDLSAEAGAAYVRNDFKVTADENHVAGRAAADARVSLPLGLELTDSVVYVPNFEETNDWQLRNDAALGSEIVAGWKAKLGMILEYDNKPEPDRQKDDETYYVGLGYKF